MGISSITSSFGITSSPLSFLTFDSCFAIPSIHESFVKLFCYYELCSKHFLLTFLSPNTNYVHFELHFLLNRQAFLSFHPTQSSSFWFLKAHSNFILKLSSFCSSILLWCEFIYCNNFNKACSFVLFNWSTKHFVWRYL